MDILLLNVARAMSRSHVDFVFIGLVFPLSLELKRLAFCHFAWLRSNETLIFSLPNRKCRMDHCVVLTPNELTETIEGCLMFIFQAICMNTINDKMARNKTTALKM